MAIRKNRKQARIKRPPKAPHRKKSTQTSSQINTDNIVIVEHVKEKNLFLQYYARLPNQRLAAASIGKDETTIIRWKHDDANFANQVSQARSFWALQKATAVPDPTWLLERIMHEEFSEKKDDKKPSDELNKSLEEALDRMATILPKAGE